MIEENNTFKAACIQFNPLLNERDKNIESLVKVVKEAAQNGAKLIVTPEMATTGYYYRIREAIAHFVDSIPGLTTSRFEEIAEKYELQQRINELKLLQHLMASLMGNAC
jgi:predicted amidohydrolase